MKPRTHVEVSETLFTHKKNARTTVINKNHPGQTGLRIPPSHDFFIMWGKKSPLDKGTPHLCTKFLLLKLDREQLSGVAISAMDRQASPHWDFPTQSRTWAHPKYCGLGAWHHSEQGELWDG